MEAHNQTYARGAEVEEDKQTKKNIMIETCETFLTRANETTYNCSTGENGLLYKKSLCCQDKAKTFINVNLNLRGRVRERKEKQKLELYALKP
jgi:hypothetical protein